MSESTGNGFGEKVWKMLQGQRLRPAEREMLKRTLHFLEPDEKDAARIESDATRRAFLDGESLVEEGDIDRAMYILLDGKVDVVHDGRVVEQLIPGEVFGEISLLSHVPRTATVQAHGRVVALEVPPEAIDEDLKERLWVYAAHRRFLNLPDLPTQDPDELRIWYTEARHIRLQPGTWDTGAPWIFVYGGTVEINGETVHAPRLVPGGAITVERPVRVALLPEQGPEEEEETWDPSSENIGDALGGLDPRGEEASPTDPSDLGRFR